MSKQSVGVAALVCLTVVLVLAAGAQASATPARDLRPVASEALDSPPPMYLSAFTVGAWSTPRGGKHYAMARAGLVDGAGAPIVGALVQVTFSIPCVKGGTDSGSAYTELVEGASVATVTGSKTFKCGTGCLIVGEVVSVSHPDYTWDPEGGVSPTGGTLCTDS